MMAQKAFADRLMDACGQHAKQIAEQWYKSLATQQKTSSFRLHSKENCLRSLFSDRFCTGRPLNLTRLSRYQ